MTLRKILNDMNWTNARMAAEVKVDPSMICYVLKGGRPSVSLATRIARAVIAHKPELDIDVSMWMLSLGFAPPSVMSASRARFQLALEILRGDA